MALIPLCNTVDNAVDYSAGWKTDQWSAELGGVGKSKVARTREDRERKEHNKNQRAEGNSGNATGLVCWV